jgi:A/G-specific adenine glycosylase
MPPFAARLIAWQRRHGRHDLPWQRTRDAYRIWLSEIMLQQTQVAMVTPYFERFIAAFPDVRALAAASRDDVLARWSGLGYYRRAHHLHAAAQAIVAELGGEFPRTQHAIAKLPGIGRSTAAAIAVFAHGERAAILDGNVKRLLARHRGIDGFPGAPRVATLLWRAAESLLPARGDVAAYTQGLMDLGAILCTRSNPKCDACPVASDCVARRTRRVDALPSPRPRKILPRRELRVLVVQRANEWLLEKRPPAGVWGGLWSLPELALETDFERFCRDRFGINVTASEPLAPIEHGFTHYKLTLHPQRLHVRGPVAQAAEPGVVWLARDEALAAALPAPIRRLLRQIGDSSGTDRGQTPVGIGSDPGVSPM